jgi:hypothetical protein
MIGLLFVGGPSDGRRSLHDFDFDRSPHMRVRIRRLPPMPWNPTGPPPRSQVDTHTYVLTRYRGFFGEVNIPYLRSEVLTERLAAWHFRAICEGKSLQWRIEYAPTGASGGAAPESLSADSGL